MTTLFGHKARLTVEVEGREIDVTDAIDIRAARVVIDEGRVLEHVQHAKEITPSLVHAIGAFKTALQKVYR